MHLDQYSLHIHSINKIKNGKTWRDIVLENFDKGTECYEHLQKRFNELVRDEMMSLGYEIEVQEKGKEYLPLAEYKKITNFNEDDENENENDENDDDENDDDENDDDENDNAIDDEDDDFDFDSLMNECEKSFENYKNIDISNIKDKDDEKEKEKENENENENEVIKK